MSTYATSGVVDLQSTVDLGLGLNISSLLLIFNPWLFCSSFEHPLHHQARFKMQSTLRSSLLSVAATALFVSTASADWWGNHNGGNGPWDGGPGNSNGCPPWVSSDDCDNNNSNGGSGNGNGGNGVADPSQYFSESQLSNSNKIVTIHAVLACLVWVL